MQAASRTDLLIARGSQSWTKKYWPSVATRHYFRREEYTHEQGIALSEYNSGSSTVGFRQRTCKQRCEWRILLEKRPKMSPLSWSREHRPVRSEAPSGVCEASSLDNASWRTLRKKT